MKIRAYITHKVKEGYVDCQDRFSISCDTKSIAVSDGMSQSWQQKIWAHLLVSTYTNSRDWSPDNDSIKPLCSQWKEEVTAFIQHLKETGAQENIIYRNERNLVEGKSAGATFVGIRFEGNDWKGTVLGDSCLVEWDGKGATIYTSQEVDAFDSHPDYFDSNPLHEGKGMPKDVSGALSANCCLFLVSDPFSDFLFEHKKHGDITEYVQQLLTLSSHEDFEILVDDWRKKGMHNDDTTIVIVESDGSEDFCMGEIDDINKLIEKEKELVSLQQNSQSVTNAKKTNSFICVQEEKSIFINDFLKEYHDCLRMKFPKQMGKLKYKWTRKAAEEALRKVLDMYSITKKK